MPDSPFRSISLKCHVHSTASIKRRRARSAEGIACTYDLEARFLEVDEADAPLALVLVSETGRVQMRSCDGRLWMRSRGHIGRTVGVEITAKNIGEVAKGALLVEGLSHSPISSTAQPFEPAIGDVVVSDGFADAQQKLHDFCADVRLIGNQIHIAMPVPMHRLVFVPTDNDKIPARLISTVEASRSPGERQYSLLYSLADAARFSEALSFHADRHGSEVHVGTRLELLGGADLIPIAHAPSVEEQILAILRSFGSMGGLVVQLPDAAFDHWVDVRRAMDVRDAVGAVHAFARLSLVDGLPKRWFRAAAHAVVLIESLVATHDCASEIKGLEQVLDIFSWRSA